MNALWQRKKTVGPIVGLILLIVSLSLFQITNFTVHGESMSPSFHEGDNLILWKSSKPKRDELVIFTVPAGWSNYSNATQNGLLLKRIKAVEGDLFAYRQNYFTVNGEKIAYAPFCSANDYTTVIPDNFILAVGDNRANSIDSLEIFCKAGNGFLVSEELVNASGRAVFH